MNAATRGIRNAFRNNIRTFSIVLILGLSIGLALAMLVARQAVQDKIESVKSSIGNTISISPAGARGFEGGGEPLTSEQISEVAKLANVSKVAQTLNDRLTSDNTDLESAIEAGSLGQRGANNSGVNFERPQFVQRDVNVDGTEDVTRTFTPPVMVTGINTTDTASVYGGDSVTFTSGAAFDASKDEDVAVVGKALAEKNNLSVGSTFQAYGKDVKVVGIYDAGNDFANGGVFLPLSTLQRLSDQTGNVSNATVTVNSIDNVDSVVTAIEDKLGDSADVVSNQEAAKAAIEPLQNVKSISMFSLVGALVAGAVIILLTMVMIVRERRREIGVMKAIGASNIRIMFQFMSEAVTLTVLALAAGLIIGVAAASPVTNALVTNSTSSTSQEPTEGPQRTMGPRGAVRSFGNNTLSNVENIKASVGLDIVAYGAGAAIVIALLGSALPAFFISKIKPAEVLRAD